MAHSIHTSSFAIPINVFVLVFFTSLWQLGVRTSVSADRHFYSMDFYSFKLKVRGLSYFQLIFFLGLLYPQLIFPVFCSGGSEISHTLFFVCTVYIPMVTLHCTAKQIHKRECTHITFLTQRLIAGQSYVETGYVYCKQSGKDFSSAHKHNKRMPIGYLIK